MAIKYSVSVSTAKQILVTLLVLSEHPKEYLYKGNAWYTAYIYSIYIILMCPKHQIQQTPQRLQV